jgi:hypothetical protein
MPQSVSHNPVREFPNTKHGGLEYTEDQCKPNAIGQWIMDRAMALPSTTQQ